MAGVAWADGDPASDVLAAQTVFLAQDGAIPAAQQSQLLPGRPTRRRAAERSRALRSRRRRLAGVGRRGDPDRGRLDGQPEAAPAASA
jgi:hypothetical protein